MSELVQPFFSDDFFEKEVSYVLLHQSSDDLKGLKLHSTELELAKSFKNTDRQQSFVLGRKAAYLALNKLGVIAPVLRGALDEPIWPEGVVGSISHSEQFAICVATTCRTFLGIGVDIELGGKGANPKITKRICTNFEFSQLPQNAQERLDKGLRIFSAKEAYYKAVFPNLRKFLGFRDVELEWEADSFRARIINPNISEKVPAWGKVAQANGLVSVCYLD